RAHFGGKLVRRLAHDAPSYSGVGASGKPGAVHFLMSSAPSGWADSTSQRGNFRGAGHNQYICPEGQTLKQFRRNYSDPNRGPTGEGVAKYRGLKHICQACPSKLRCCPNMDFRSITPEEHEDARQVARDIAKTRQYEVSMKLRKKVEMLFAHLKRILGLGRFRLRGPCGANDEFLLAATAQNLRKPAKIFPAPQQPRKA
ncbi:transposase, partial [Allgaiera indica]